MAEARVVRPDRRQLRWDMIDLEGLLPADHRARKEPACLKAWRERMASEAGQAVYALRQRIERINADRKNHGFGFLPVRGLIKAKAHALWHALANNLVAARRLRIETP